MGYVRIALDRHTLNRLEALLLMRNAISEEKGNVLKEAVETGLDVLLSEALAKTSLSESEAMGRSS